MIVLLTIFVICEPIEWDATCIYYYPTGGRQMHCAPYSVCPVYCILWWVSHDNMEFCLVASENRSQPATSHQYWEITYGVGFWKRLHYDPSGPCLIYGYWGDRLQLGPYCLYDNPNYATPSKSIAPTKTIAPTSPFTEDPNPAVRIYGNPATILMLFPLIHEKYVGAY